MLYQLSYRTKNMNINTRNWFCCYLRTVLVICTNNLAIDTYLYSLYFGRESNPYRHCCPRDFLTTLALIQANLKHTTYSLTLERIPTVFTKDYSCIFFKLLWSGLFLNHIWNVATYNSYLLTIRLVVRRQFCFI